MSKGKVIIIAVFGALLILCIGVQIISTNDAEADQILSKQQQNYFYVH